MAGRANATAPTLPCRPSASGRSRRIGLRQAELPARDREPVLRSLLRRALGLDRSASLARLRTIEPGDALLEGDLVTKLIPLFARFYETIVTLSAFLNPNRDPDLQPDSRLIAAPSFPEGKRSFPLKTYRTQAEPSSRRVASSGLRAPSAPSGVHTLASRLGGLRIRQHAGI